MENETITSGKARYAKNKLSLRISTGTELGGRGQRLARAMNFRFSNREHAYIISVSQEKRFRKLYDEGRDGTLFGKLEEPDIQSEVKACRKLDH